MKLRCGRKTIDPLQVSPDAEFILEGEEFDLPWRLCRPHPTWYRDAIGRTAQQAIPVMTTTDDHKRFAAIRTWIREQYANDIDAAIDSHPLIALSNGELLDGWHRLAVWMSRPGKRFPAAIVGELP